MTSYFIICSPAHKTPSEKGSTIKEKNLLTLFFPFRVDSFSKGAKCTTLLKCFLLMPLFRKEAKTVDRVSSPENVSVHLNFCPFEPGYTLPLQTVQIQISWLLKKPTDLDLHCLPLSKWIWSNNVDQVTTDWQKIESGLGFLIYLTRVNICFSLQSWHLLRSILVGFSFIPSFHSLAKIDFSLLTWSH